MCSVPKTPKVEKTPVRQAAVLPDGGNPAARYGSDARRRLASSAMIFANRQGQIGAPSVSALGVTGNG